MNSNANESAMPVSTNDLTKPRGLTKREYFAGLAMQGILGNSKLLAAIESMDGEPSRNTVIIALCHADALLAELAKGADDAKA